MESKLRKETENFTTIPVTDYSIEKIKSYARLAKGSELYGFLLSKFDSEDGIVTDVLLAQSQYASSGSAGINKRNVSQSKAEIENLGCKALGFWHSHGSFGAFHSGIDDNNLEELLKDFAGNNEEKAVKNNKEYSYVSTKDYKIAYKTNKLEVFVTLNNNNDSYENKLVGEDFLKLASDENIKLIAALTDDLRIIIQDGPNIIIAKNPVTIEIKTPVHEITSTGAAYSIVVNNTGEIYAEMGVTKWCSFCEIEETKVLKDVKLQMIETGNFMIEDEKLLNDIEERVINHRHKGAWNHLRDMFGKT